MTDSKTTQKQKNASKRPTQFEVTERVEHVRERLLQGASRTQCLELAVEWGVTSRTIETYMARARARIVEDANSQRQNLLEFHLQARREIYRRAIANRDGKLALDVLRDEAKLTGLYVPPDLQTLVHKEVKTAIAATILRAKEVLDDESYRQFVLCLSGKSEPNDRSMRRKEPERVN